VSSATAASTSQVNPGLSQFAQKILRRQKQPPGPTLFVGNLSFDATAETIRTLFEAHEEYRAQKAKKRENEEKEKGKGKRKQDDNSDEGEESNDEMGNPPKEESSKSERSLVKVRVGQFEDSGKCKG
jgi:hypothetical protein